MSVFREKKDTKRKRINHLLSNKTVQVERGFSEDASMMQNEFRKGFFLFPATSANNVQQWGILGTQYTMCVAFTFENFLNLANDAFLLAHSIGNKGK